MRTWGGNKRNKINNGRKTEKLEIDGGKGGCAFARAVLLCTRHETRDTKNGEEGQAVICASCRKPEGQRLYVRRRKQTTYDVNTDSQLTRAFVLD